MNLDGNCFASLEDRPLAVLTANLLGRRPAILSPCSPAASNSSGLRIRLKKENKVKERRNVGDQSGRANMSAHSKAASSALGPAIGAGGAG